jgi:biopolymer transport protein ExbB
MGESSTLVERLLNSNLLEAEWVLWFLLLLFVVGSVIVLWKVAWFTVNGARARLLRDKVASLVAGGDLASFRDEVGNLRGVEAAVLHQALRYSDAGADVVDQQMGVALSSGKQRMELGLTFLGTLGANAPFVGLFGTVLGVIKAFRDLSLDTKAGAAAVMAGISEALVATAVGLVVAIPAVVAYNYLQRQVKKTMNSAGAINQQVLYRLRGAESER